MVYRSKLSRLKPTIANKASITPKTTLHGTVMPEIKSEHELQKACVAMLRSHNMICSCTDVFNAISFMRDIRSKAIYKQHMIRMGGSVGFPDLIILNKGKCTFVEFKWKKGKKSPEQEQWTKNLIDMGYEVLEWRTLEDCSLWTAKQIKETEGK